MKEPLAGDQLRGGKLPHWREGDGGGELVHLRPLSEEPALPRVRILAHYPHRRIVSIPSSHRFGSNGKREVWTRDVADHNHRLTGLTSGSFWGDRYGAVVDPYGHRWSVATHVRQVSLEEFTKPAQQIQTAGI